MKLSYSRSIAEALFKTIKSQSNYFNDYKNPRKRYGKEGPSRNENMIQNNFNQNHHHHMWILFFIWSPIVAFSFNSEFYLLLHKTKLRSRVYCLIFYLSFSSCSNQYPFFIFIRNKGKIIFLVCYFLKKKRTY